MMNDALKFQEEETAKKIAAEKAAQQPVAAAPGKKADPKAAAKGAKDKGKGAPATDDPNSPKDITIEYPEVQSLPDFVVIEHTYRKMRANAYPARTKNEKPDPTVDKKALRLQNLQDSYEMVRGLPINCATIVKLNYVEPPKPVVEEQEVVPEPTKAPVKGKKK